MAYQCLKCGSCFTEGTTTILRGCPDCRGMRFFYTDTPLTSREREERLKETTEALPSLIEKITERASHPSSPGSAPSERLVVPPAFKSPGGEGRMLPDGSLVVKIPKAIEARIKRAVTGWDYEVPATNGTKSLAKQLETAVPPSELPPPGPEAAPVSAPAPATTAAPVPESASDPETVRISNPGQYEIDVRRLLEKSPIVIQKDGTYLIHLASLFDMPKPPRP